MQHGMTAGACDASDAGRFISASIIQLAVDCSCNIGASVGTARGSLAARHVARHAVNQSCGWHVMRVCVGWFISASIIQLVVVVDIAADVNRRAHAADSN